MAAVPPDFTDGDTLTLDDINTILACLRELMTRPPGVELMYVKTPPGGIVAGSFAECTFCGRNPFAGGVMIEGTTTVRVWHLPGATEDIGGDLYLVAGLVNNVWTALGLAC